MGWMPRPEPLTQERLSSRRPPTRALSPGVLPAKQGRTRLLGPALPASLPLPLIVDPAHASRAVVLIKLRGIGHNVVRDEHFCLIRSSRYRRAAAASPSPRARLLPTRLAATHTHSRGPPRAAHTWEVLTYERAWGVDAFSGDRRARASLERQEARPSCFGLNLQ